MRRRLLLLLVLVGSVTAALLPGYAVHARHSLESKPTTAGAAMAARTKAAL